EPRHLSAYQKHRLTKGTREIQRMLGPTVRPDECRLSFESRDEQSALLAQLLLPLLKDASRYEQQGTTHAAPREKSAQDHDRFDRLAHSDFVTQQPSSRPRGRCLFYDPHLMRPKRDVWCHLIAVALAIRKPWRFQREAPPHPRLQSLPRAHLGASRGSLNV